MIWQLLWRMRSLTGRCGCCGRKGQYGSKTWQWCWDCFAFGCPTCRDIDH